MLNFLCLKSAFQIHNALNSGNKAILLFFNKILKILMKGKIILKKVSPFWVLLHRQKFKMTQNILKIK